MALPVAHNCENYSYIVEHEEFGKLVFCTDAISFPYKIKDVNHLFIEANYSEDLMIDNLCKNETIHSHNEFHMEINTTIEAIRRNISPNLRTLCLIHLSDGQSSESGFKKRIFKEFGVNCYVADKGLEVVLDKFDF